VASCFRLGKTNKKLINDTDDENGENYENDESDKNVDNDENDDVEDQVITDTNKIWKAKHKLKEIVNTYFKHCTDWFDQIV
jgi:hypothetical protein